MDEFKEILSGGPWAVLGAIATMLGGGFYAVRKFIRSDRVEGAATGAQLDVIEQLRTLLKEANERADLERKRADDAFAARNDALASVGELKVQVSRLEEKLAYMQKILDGKGDGKGN